MRGVYLTFSQSFVRSHCMRWAALLTIGGSGIRVEVREGVRACVRCAHVQMMHELILYEYVRVYTPVTPTTYDESIQYCWTTGLYWGISDYRKFAEELPLDELMMRRVVK